MPGRQPGPSGGGREANVTADVVEISEFPDLAAQYHVRGVPKIVMNDTVELVGAQPEAAFVDAMLRAAA